MCVSQPKGPSISTPRDTSSDPIVSKYATPPELVGKTKKKGTKSLVNFGGPDNMGDAAPSGGGLGTGTGALGMDLG